MRSYNEVHACLCSNLTQFLSYGHRRFANPADLNGATGWLFLNDPGDVHWVCASNTRNYSRRYLPVCAYASLQMVQSFCSRVCMHMMFHLPLIKRGQGHSQSTSCLEARGACIANKNAQRKVGHNTSGLQYWLWSADGHSVPLHMNLRVV
jgi:hypothetical protein